MKKIRRKITSGVLLGSCSLFALYGASRIAERTENGVLPVSLAELDSEKPIIVLDAGHDGSN